jgi:hypothetical protein
MATPLDIIVTDDIDVIRAAAEDGYCPVECSIDGDSIVDDLVMDHHGRYAHLDSVAIRAYTTLYGARHNDPRFVVAGTVDADASFAIASLAGLLPHPNRNNAHLRPDQIAAWTADLTELAGTVARLDVDPIGVRLIDLPGGDIVATWNALSGSGRDQLSALGGISLWRTLTTGNVDVYLAAAARHEQDRFDTAIADQVMCGTVVDGVLVIDGATTWGFDVWYGRNSSAPADTVAGWDNPIVMSRTRNGNITVGCPNRAVAETLFGPGGLANVFAHLTPTGWGGRSTVCGSPRGTELTSADAHAAAQQLAAARVS